MDVLSYVLMRKIFRGSNSESIYEYLRLAAYDPQALSAIASKVLADMDMAQSGSVATAANTSLAKLALLGIFSPVRL